MWNVDRTEHVSLSARHTMCANLFRPYSKFFCSLSLKYAGFGPRLEFEQQLIRRQDISEFGHWEQEDFSWSRVGPTPDNRGWEKSFMTQRLEYFVKSLTLLWKTSSGQPEVTNLTSKMSSVKYLMTSGGENTGCRSWVTPLQEPRKSYRFSVLLL